MAQGVGIPVAGRKEGRREAIHMGRGGGGGGGGWQEGGHKERKGGEELVWEDDGKKRWVGRRWEGVQGVG